MAWLVCVTLIVVFFSILFYWSKKKFSYWTEKGVIGPTPYPVVGNFGSVMLVKDSAQAYVKRVHLKYQNEKLIGMYRGFKPVILVRDPELIKLILVKDFHIFQDRGMSSSRSKLSNNLFSAEGETWKILRQKLTPVFTSRKLKDMIPLMLNCVDNFIRYVDSLVVNNKEHEIRSLISKFTLEVIGSCAFGLDLNTATDEENEFSVMAKKIFQPSMFIRIVTLIDMIIPGTRKMFSLNTEIQDFFVKLVQSVIEKRGGKPSGRKDFMDLMIELREQGKAARRTEDGKSEIEIDDYMIAAQALVFYSAGFETSAASMSFLIHEMALNPDIQERVHEEVSRVYEKCNGQLNYECIKDMPYLEMVFHETLRKYSVAGILFRKCSAQYTFPGTNVTIPKDMVIMISANGLNADPKYFPNPEKFDPETFSPENIKNIPQCVYMPFGEGPRNCIGMRFANVQSMLGTAAFFKHYKVEPSLKTRNVLEYDPKGIVLVTKHGIWVKISKR